MVRSFFYNGDNFGSELDKILMEVKKRKNIVLSLLDKWNRANHIMKADEFQSLYLDEAILNYFHIIELLSDTIKKDYERTLDGYCQELLLNFYEYSNFFSKNQIKDKVKQKKKLVKEVLIGNFIPLSEKFKYFLKHYNLLNDQVSYFTDKIIKIRNTLAHGKIVQNLDIMEYPLTPFYNIASNERAIVDPLKFLTAASISKFIGINTWVDKWKEVADTLEPSFDLVKEFLENKLKVDINYKNKKNLTWHSLFLYYLAAKESPKKIIEQRVKKELNKRNFEDLNLLNLYDLAVVLINTDDSDLFNLLSKIIVTSVKKQEYRWSNYKDIFTYLEVRNIDVKNIKSIVSDILNQ